MGSLQQAWKSFIRRGWRIPLLVVPTAFLFGLISLLIVAEGAFSTNAVDKNDARYLRAGSPHGRPKLFFSQAEYQRLAKIPHVEAVGTLLPRAGETKEVGGEEPGLLEATDSTYRRIWNFELPVPAQELEHWDRVKNGAIVSKQVADRHGWHVGDTIEVPTSNGTSARLIITYISDGIWRYGVEIHKEFIQNLGMDPVAWVAWMVVDDVRNIAEVKKAVTAVFPGRPLELYTMVESKAIVLGNRSLLLLFAFRMAGSLSMILVIAISLTLLSLSVEERRCDLAILRVIGFGRGQVAMIIVIESILNLLPGAIIGGLVVHTLFKSVGIPFSPIFEPTVTWGPIFFTWLGAVIFGTVAALIPAWRVLTMDVLSALRGV